MDEKKQKQMRVNQDGIKMTADQELAIYLLFKQNKTVEEVKQKVLRPDGSPWSDTKLRGLFAKFRKNKAPTATGDQAEKAYSTLMGIDLESDLKDFDAERSMSRSFKMAARLLEKALEDAEKGYEIEDEQRRQIPIKTIMECIEKAGRFWSLSKKTQKDSGRTGNFKIDYREMAKIYVEKKQEGVAYDAKGHMKAILDTVHAQQTDDSAPSEFEDHLEDEES